MESLEVEKAQNIPKDFWATDQSHNGLKLQEIIAASGISVPLWRLYAYFWLVCLFFPILSLIQTPPPGSHLLIAA